LVATVQRRRHASDLGRAIRLLGCRGVFVVGEVLAPLGVAFGQGEVGHERSGCGAVPVPLAGRGDDGVAGSDPDGLSAASLNEAFAFREGESLAEAVPVPRSVGAGCEMHRSERYR
jgi:hypothetical protein